MTEASTIPAAYRPGKRRRPGPETHHNGAAQVFADPGGARVTRNADVLPDALADAFSPLMAAGLAVMSAHLSVAPET